MNKFDTIRKRLIEKTAKKLAGKKKVDRSHFSMAALIVDDAVEYIIWERIQLHPFFDPDFP